MHGRLLSVAAWGRTQQRRPLFLDMNCILFPVKVKFEQWILYLSFKHGNSTKKYEFKTEELSQRSKLVPAHGVPDRWVSSKRMNKLRRLGFPPFEDDGFNVQSPWFYLIAWPKEGMCMY